MKYYILLFLFIFCQNLIGQKDSLERIKLLFVGDIMQHAPQIKAAEIKPNKTYDYESCFKYVHPIISAADFAVGNLEVTLPGKPPYRGYPQFRSPDDLAKGLRAVGFDMMVTANNHSNDAGKKGVINTIETLKNNGLNQTGTFKNQAERDLLYPLIVYKNNFKLCFLNYTYGTNGLKTRKPTIVNYIDTALIRQDLLVAKSKKPDFIIVFMHWGKEYKLNESKQQQKLAAWLLENGGDLVIGAHPHVVQPIKIYDNTTTNDPNKKLIVYSMGNFISNQTKPNTDGGIMVEIELVKNKKKHKTYLDRHYYIPVWRYIHKTKKGRRKYFAIPVSAFEKDDTLLKMPKSDKERMRRFAKKTRTHLEKWSGVEQKIDMRIIKQGVLE